MIKVIVQKKTINKNIEQITKGNLSIQFSLDGFSFCISNQNKKPLHLTQYIFDKKLESPHELLKQIEQIFSSDKHLQMNFSEVTVIHQNSLNTIVPNDYFSENEIKNYLDYSIKTLSTDYVSFDDIQSINAKNVYIPYVNLNNFLFQNFGEFEYQHHTTVLLEKLIDYHAQNSVELFCHVSKTALDIICLDNGKLNLYNSFEYETKEDFIYYILFVMEQLKLDTEETPLTFIGDIHENSDIYRISFDYVRDVRFLQSNNEFFNSNSELKNHSNFLLL